MGLTQRISSFTYRRWLNAPLVHSQRSFPIRILQVRQASTTPLNHSSTLSKPTTTKHELFKTSIRFLPATHEIQYLTEADVGKPVVVHGYIGSRTDTSKRLSFIQLFSKNVEQSIQLVSAKEGREPNHKLLQSLNPQTPVVIEGVLKSKKPTANPSDHNRLLSHLEIDVTRVQCLNQFPSDILVAPGTRFPPEQRYLQLRLEKDLRTAIAFRSKALQICHDELANNQDFLEVETPILFKSTPEGAREFIVPTRTKGLAYALPQSPQQYKQMLMASGVPKYFQVARCFRDEDKRADRQPEFTQIDLEMAFSSAEDVQLAIEKLVQRLWSELLEIQLPKTFPRMDYQTAMAIYGSDKPDIRLGMEISRVDQYLPSDLPGKISNLQDPIVEAFKFSPSDTPSESIALVSEFMDSPDGKQFLQNTDGQPGFCIYDPTKPLSGMPILGFDAAETIEQHFDLQPGDVLVLQARPNQTRHVGGSTSLGRLRLALNAFAVEKDLIPAPTGFEFLWVNDFPLFTPETATDGPGQGGNRGLTATHHPFTSPKRPEDVDLLEIDPLSVRGDHYDLVVNGSEVAGGSRRIHDADFQKYVLSDILGVSGARMDSFGHLLEALRAGCPPHSGIAIGFDRLMALMLGKSSVRDVIAFPKSGSGEDLMVKSPTRISDEQMETYGIKFRE